MCVCVYVCSRHVLELIVPIIVELFSTLEMAEMSASM